MGGGFQAKSKAGAYAWDRVSGSLKTGSRCEHGDGGPTRRCLLGLSGQRRGVFRLTHRVRPAVRELLSALNHGRRTTLLSGDSERDRPVFAAHFNDGFTSTSSPSRA